MDSNTRTLWVSIAILVISALIAIYMRVPATSNAIKRENYMNVDEEQDDDAMTRALMITQPWTSPRHKIIENTISRLYFYNTTSKTSELIRNDKSRLFESVQATLTFKPESSFEKLCYGLNISNETQVTQSLDKKRNQHCSIMFLDRFAQKDDRMYPTFEKGFAEAVSGSIRDDNALYKINANTYQITKNFWTPKQLFFSHDTTANLIRMIFYSSATNERANPTYMVLAQPFAIDFENIGTFNVVYDINPDYNILNFYHTAEDWTARSLFIEPIPDYIGEIQYNTISSSATLSELTRKLDNPHRTRQYKFYHSDFFDSGTQTGIVHTHTIELHSNKNSSNSAQIFNYTGAETSFVNSTNISFVNSQLTITVDSKEYLEFVKEANAIFAAPGTSEYSIYVTFAYNTMRLAVFYRKLNGEHHVLVKRTHLVRGTANAYYNKVFAFDVAQPKAENKFIHSSYVPNLLRTADALGYLFTRNT